MKQQHVFLLLTSLTSVSDGFKEEEWKTSLAHNRYKLLQKVSCCCGSKITTFFFYKSIKSELLWNLKLWICFYWIIDSSYLAPSSGSHVLIQRQYCTITDLSRTSWLTRFLTKVYYTDLKLNRQQFIGK